MKDFLQTFSRVLIALLVLWHMTAVAIYAIPFVAKDPLSAAIKRFVQPWTNPYVLMTSQWQQWNMFSPDPQRRVQTYAVDIDVPSALDSRPLLMIDTHTYSWWRHAARFKFLGNMFDEPVAHRPLFEHFLWQTCAAYGIAPGIGIHLITDTYILPLNTRAADMHWWRGYNPTHTRQRLYDSTCP